MHGKSNMTRRPTVHALNRLQKAPSATPIAEITDKIDVGDWVLAQDEEGSLVVHNVVTGNRITIGRP